jgi:hypothetical protein
MGYHTEFIGEVNVEPPLNAAEVEYLKRFSSTRRMWRKSGPYTVVDNLPSVNPNWPVSEWDRKVGQVETADVLDYNSPPPGQPGLWCQWEPTDDGKFIRWDGGEKFYDSPQWMEYLITNFLQEGAAASRSGDPQFADFTFNHVLNGVINAEGEEQGDVWKLIVTNNDVTTKHAKISWDDE